MTWTLFITHAGCFVLGLVVMRWLTRRGLEKATDLTDHVHQEHPVPKPSEHVTLLGVVALVCGLILFGLGIRVGYQLLDEQVDCFDTYASQLDDAQDARQAAIEKRDQRELEVFAATSRLLSQPGGAGDGDDLRKALNAYLRADAELTTERAENPYPEAPREVC